MDKSESIKELAAALSKAQAEMGGAIKGATNPFFNSSYADISEVIKAIKEPFANHGLSYSQFPIEDGGRIGIETILMHSSGNWLSQKFTVNLVKQDAQAAGAAITYCRRYGLQAIAGIPSEDDDGNGTVNKTDPVIKSIQDMINKNDINAVHKEWQGIIKSSWNNLDAKTTESLNDMIKQQPGGK